MLGTRRPRSGDSAAPYSLGWVDGIGQEVQARTAGHALGGLPWLWLHFLGAGGVSA